MQAKLAPDPSQQDCPRHGMMSLWLMITATADFFVKIQKALSELKCSLRLGGETPIPDSFRAASAEHFATIVRGMTGIADKVPMRNSLAGAKRLQAYGASATSTQAGLLRAIEELENRMGDELEAITMLLMTKHLDKTNVRDKLGDAAASAFPSSILDVQEAGLCLMFGRSTACVLHLMRGLEKPLFAMATDLLVDPSKPNWNLLLNDIESQVRRRKGDAGSKSKLPDLPDSFWNTRDKDFYTKATTHFFFIKNAWRNYAAHGTETYTMDQAEEIYNNVVAFMKHLAVHFSEAC